MGSLFNFISNPMDTALSNLAVLVSSAGIAIILFTIGIRAVLSPLQIIQLRSARAMQRLQPKIKEIRDKHGKDRQKITQDTMALYKEHKVNPAMGCLPMLLQFPILIGLFWALQHLGISPSAKDTLHGVPTNAWLKGSYHYSLQAWQLFHANFLWLSNGLGLPDPLYILPVLAGVTQWIQSKMMMQKSTDPQQQTMNMLMNFTPLIIVFFATRYASGLSLYWVTSTVIGIAITASITGWGSLPRLDRMLLGKQSTATALVSTKQKKPLTQPKPKSPNGDGNGKVSGDSDGLLSAPRAGKASSAWPASPGETPTDHYSFLELPHFAPVQDVRSAVEAQLGIAGNLDHSQPLRSHDLRDRIRQIKDDLLTTDAKRLAYDSALRSEQQDASGQRSSTELNGDIGTIEDRPENGNASGQSNGRRRRRNPSARPRGGRRG